MVVFVRHVFSDQALDSNHRLSIAQLIERQVTTDPSTYAAININKGKKKLLCHVKYVVLRRWLNIHSRYQGAAL